MSQPPSKVPEAVQWHEGMLLTPQHFQQAFLRQDLLLQYHVAATAPYPWGVRRLQVDQAMLVGGIFRLSDLEAILPDGLLVSHPLDGQDLSLDLSPHEDAIRERPRTVYLAVPVQRTTAAAKGELERYSSVDGGPVADMNTGEGEVLIPRLRPRPRLILDDDVPPAYVAMPIARVTVREEALGLDDYMPPVLGVSPLSLLGMECQALARRLREKAAYLVDRVRAPTAATADHMISETRGIVAALVSDLPPFEALLGSGVAHPFTLYVALCGVVGKLAMLSPELMPPVLPAYDHHDLMATFGRALDFGRRMVDSVHETCMAVPFRMHEGSFSLPLRESWLSSRMVIGVRRRAGESDTDAIQWIEDAIIGAASQVQSIGARRIRGTERQVIDRDEALGVMPGRGQTLFALTYDPGFIQAGEPLVIINRADLRGHHAPAEVVLFVPIGDGTAPTKPSVLRQEG
ncbi:type VI secretion system baseplate subunit TssK [Insolitispirillum peregrinum]|uniref:type VI secretion system baseplate subunit TssK n=1 Tax=Insolitispirillum peregrinum TaxID=80876 RepID=UPI0036163740